MVQYLLVRNGQHLSGNLTRIRLTLPQLWYMVEAELYEYQQFIPVTKKFNISVGVQAGPAYDFTTDSHNPGFDITDQDNPVFGNTPQWISKVVPVGSNQMIANWAAWKRTDQFPGQLGKLIQPRTMIPNYRKPVLYITEAGRFDVECHYHYFTKVESNTVGDIEEITDYIVQDIDQSQGYMIFRDMVSARFLQMIGRSRRAFSHNELPITTDAAQLVTEGEANYEKALEKLHARSNWHKSIKH